MVIQIPADFPAVHGDRHALLQVLLNLARNALRAVQPLPQPRRQLIVSARMEQGSAVLSVRDTGPGIAEPGRLFQPFRSDRGDIRTGRILRQRRCAEAARGRRAHQHGIQWLPAQTGLGRKRIAEIAVMIAAPGQLQFQRLQQRHVDLGVQRRHLALAVHRGNRGADLQALIRRVIDDR
ncbi:hypothetical protein QUF31_21335 [Dickeya chrysanthemi]|nr:ATP-binding protein [Dickeya chrysanthemi]WJM85505.1 hypothetical protein QUF31_21335 [Dickeya chrysanthemi]